MHAGVTKKTIAAALDEMRTDRVLPYRFIAAARYAPDLEPELEKAMFRSIEGHAAEGQDAPSGRRVGLDGRADVGASEMRRLDAATGLAVLAREIATTSRSSRSPTT